MNKKYNILIIEPALPDENNKIIKRKKLHYFSMSSIQLAAYFPEKYNIEIINETIDTVPLNKIYNAVFITSMGASLLRAIDIADEFRKKKIPVIAGGTGVLIFQDECAGKFDSIAIGECETYIERLIKDFEENKLEKVYRPLYSADLSNIKHPRYDLLNHKKLKMFYPVQATRGCTSRCEFCYLNIMGDIYRKRPVKDVIDDIITIKSYSINGVVFADENLICSREYALELLNAMIPLKIRWIAHIDIRVCFDDEFIDLARRSGCQSVTIGFETLNIKNILNIKKSINNDRDYSHAIKNLHNAGISIIGNFIIGLEEDTIETGEDIVSFAIKYAVDFFVLSILAPIRGTPLYSSAVSSNRLLGYEMKDAVISKSMIKMPYMTGEEIENTYHEILKRVYTLSSIFRRTIFNKSEIPFHMRIINFAVNLIMRRNVQKNNFIGII